MPSICVLPKMTCTIQFNFIFLWCQGRFISEIVASLWEGSLKWNSWSFPQVTTTDLHSLCVRFVFWTVMMPLLSKRKCFFPDRCVLWSRIDICHIALHSVRYVMCRDSFCNISVKWDVLVKCWSKWYGLEHIRWRKWHLREAAVLYNCLHIIVSPFFVDCHVWFWIVGIHNDTLWSSFEYIGYFAPALASEGSFMCGCIWHAPLGEKCLHHKVL